MQRAVGFWILFAVLPSFSGCRSKDPGASPRDSGAVRTRDGAPSASPSTSAALRRDAAIVRDARVTRTPPTSFGAGSWHLVPETEVPGSDCHVYTTAGPGPFHPLPWMTCGAGCETADVTANLGPWVATSAAGTRQGVAYAFWGHPLGDAAGHDFLEHLVRLRDGVTVAAMGVQFGGPTCANSYAPNSALTLWHLAGPEDAERQSWALAADPSRGWTFTPNVPLSDEPAGRMAFEAGARIIGLGKGTVHALVPPSSKWEILESPSSSLYGAGGDDWAVWVESDSRRLRAFRADGAGIRTLTESLPKTSCALAVGSSAVIGAAADGCLGGSRTLQIWSVPKAEGSTPSVVATVKGPVFLSAPDSIRSYGDYAAVLLRPLQDAGTQGAPYFVLVQLSTGKVWRVDGRAPFVIQDTTWILDDTFLYWGERSDADVDGHLLRRMVRISLSKLDAIGTHL